MQPDFDHPAAAKGSPDTCPWDAAGAAALGEVTAVVKTFERHRSLDRLIRSVRRFYPAMPIIVADDSFRPRPRRDVETIRLPADSGVGYGRTALLRHVRTRYFLTLDDDFQFTEATRLERLLGLLVTGRADLAAGDCVRVKRKWFRVRQRPQPYFGTIELGDGRLRLTPGFRETHPGYGICDIVPQFFIAETHPVLDLGGWDPRLKTNDHQEFFVKLQRHGFRVGYCPTVSLLHWHTMPKRYAAFRFRDHRHVAARIMGVTHWIDLNGREYHFPKSEPLSASDRPGFRRESGAAARDPRPAA